MKLKTGDTVKIIAGRDKGKTGKIIQSFPELGRIVIDGVNRRTRHIRPQKRGEKGEKIEFFAPVASAAAMLLCAKCGKETRSGFKFIDSPSGGRKKIRVCKKCGEAVE